MRWYSRKLNKNISDQLIAVSICSERDRLMAVKPTTLNTSFQPGGKVDSDSQRHELVFLPNNFFSSLSSFIWKKQHKEIWTRSRTFWFEISVFLILTPLKPKCPLLIILRWIKAMSLVCVNDASLDFFFFFLVAFLTQRGVFLFDLYPG